VKLVVVPFDAPGCLGRVGSRRNDPATAIGAPRADTNRGFRVSRSIFDATRHVGVFVACGSNPSPSSAESDELPL